MITLQKAVKAILSKGVGEIQSMRPAYQLVAVAKGIIEPQDLRIGGELRAQDSSAIISMIAQDDFLKSVRVETMSKLNKNVDVFDMSPRQSRRVPEGTPASESDKAKPAQKGCKLTALDIDLYSDIGLSTLRDNADNPNLIQMIQGMIATGLQNDVSDLAWNGKEDGDGTVTDFVKLNKGWIQVAEDSIAKGSGVINTEVTLGSSIAATLNILEGNAGIVFTAVKPGSGGNALIVGLVEPGVESAPLSVLVSNNVITVNLETDSNKAIVSTAAEVIAAVNATPSAAVLMIASPSPGSDASAVVSAFNYANLFGGSTVGIMTVFDALASSASNLYLPSSVMIVSPRNKRAYDKELGLHVTGEKVITDAAGNKYTGSGVVAARYMPDNFAMLTPLKNLVVGIHKDMRRDAVWKPDRKVVEHSLHTATDYEIAIKEACVLAKIK